MAIIDLIKKLKKCWFIFKMNINYDDYYSYEAYDYKEEFGSRWYHFRDFIMGTTFSWDVLHYIYSFILEDIKTEVTKQQIQYMVYKCLKQRNEKIDIDYTTFQFNISNFIFRNHNISTVDLIDMLMNEFKKKNINCVHCTGTDHITNDIHLFSLNYINYSSAKLLECYNLDESYNNSVTEVNEDTLLLKENGEEIDTRLQNLIKQRERDDLFFASL
jgi:hypothetical protein